MKFVEYLKTIGTGVLTWGFNNPAKAVFSGIVFATFFGVLMYGILLKSGIIKPKRRYIEATLFSVSDDGGLYVATDPSTKKIQEMNGNVEVLLEDSKAFRGMDLSGKQRDKFVARFAEFLNDKYREDQSDVYRNLDSDVVEVAQRMRL